MTRHLRRQPTGQDASQDAGLIREIMELIGKCRGFALNTGVLAVLISTETDPAEREDLVQEFLSFRAMFLEAIVRKSQIGTFLDEITEIGPHRAHVHRFRETLSALPDDHLEITREEAAALAWRARREVLPAIYAILEVLGRLEDQEAEAHLARMAEKAAMVDGMLMEMGRIGRMIGLISINASVEAARAGGESGRSFQVIAEEVRSLAKQSSDLLDRMKNRMAEDEALERVHLRRMVG